MCRARINHSIAHKSPFTSSLHTYCSRSHKRDIEGRHTNTPGTMLTLNNNIWRQTSEDLKDTNNICHLVMVERITLHQTTKQPSQESTKLQNSKGHKNNVFVLGIVGLNLPLSNNLPIKPRIIKERGKKREEQWVWQNNKISLRGFGSLEAQTIHAHGIRARDSYSILW